MRSQAGNEARQKADVSTRRAVGDHDPTLLLRVEAAADRLSLSRSMVWSLVSSGAIRSIHIGRARRIVAADLARWVAEQEAEGNLPVRE